MVSVSAAGFNAITSANTLSLFKRSEDDKTAAKVVTPSVQASTADRLGAIADLAAKLIDIKNGDSGDSSSIRVGPRSVGDRVRPLTAEERATEKANWEAFYQGIVDEARANLPEKVTESLLQNDLYRNDPTFQAALKNGTLSIQEGDSFGQSVAPKELVFDDKGYYTGVRSDGYTVSDRIWDTIENVDGRFVAKADGKNVAIGAVNGVTFFATWPS
jgi:hypothetical protein